MTSPFNINQTNQAQGEIQFNDFTRKSQLTLRQTDDNPYISSKRDINDKYYQLNNVNLDTGNMNISTYGIPSESLDYNNRMFLSNTNKSRGDGKDIAEIKTNTKPLPEKVKYLTQRTGLFRLSGANVINVNEVNNDSYLKYNKFRNSCREYMTFPINSFTTYDNVGGNLADIGSQIRYSTIKNAGNTEKPHINNFTDRTFQYLQNVRSVLPNGVNIIGDRFGVISRNDD